MGTLPAVMISERTTLGPAPVSTTALAGLGVCHGTKWYDAPTTNLSLQNSNSVLLNRERYRLSRQGQRAGTDHVALTPCEANVTQLGATGELRWMGRVKEIGEITPPRRFPPRGAPLTGLPLAGRPPHPYSLAPRPPAGRPTAWSRRKCGLGKGPATHISVG